MRLAFSVNADESKGSKSDNSMFLLGFSYLLLHAMQNKSMKNILERIRYIEDFTYLIKCYILIYRNLSDRFPDLNNVTPSMKIQIKTLVIAIYSHRHNANSCYIININNLSNTSCNTQYILTE